MWVSRNRVKMRWFTTTKTYSVHIYIYDEKLEIYTQKKDFSHIIILICEYSKVKSSSFVLL
jgi:hypothetical protein